MKTKLHFLLFMITVTLLQIGCETSPVNSQTKSVANGRVGGEEITSERVEDEFERLRWDGINKEDLMKQPAPKFFMVFKCQETENADCINGERRQELSDDGQELVNEYWQALLNYKYVMGTDRAISVDEETNKRMADNVRAAQTKFGNSMQKTSIIAPDGERKISFSELNQMMGFLNNYSCNTIQQSDICKVYDWKKKQWRVVET